MDEKELTWIGGDPVGSTRFHEHVSRLRIPENRARKDFKDLDELAEGIRVYGLLNPPVFTDPDENGVRWLVAGERRFRAMRDVLGWTRIPITIFSALDELTRREIELEENVNREDFDWLEQAELEAEIHKLKQQKYGIAKPGVSNPEAWTMKKTADLVKMPVSEVSNRIKFIEEIKEKPELRDKYKKMPQSVAMKMHEQEKTVERAKRLVDSGQIILSSAILLGSCLDLIKKEADASFDCLITDPPFANQSIEDQSGDNANVAREKQNYLTRLEPEDNSTRETFRPLMEQLVPELFRVLKPGAYFYIFYAEPENEFLRPLLERAGFEFFRPSTLIWDKGRNVTAFNGYNYLSTYEPILGGYKPPKSRRLNEPMANILRFAPLIRDAKIHPFEKPQELLQALVKNSTNPGDRVLDPFAGSGATIRAAQILGRSGVGYELNEKHYLAAQTELIKKGGPT